MDAIVTEEPDASIFQDYLTLNMDVADSSDTFLSIYHTSRRNIQAEHNLRSHHFTETISSLFSPNDRQKL
jgi:hypothetical protein